MSLERDRGAPQKHVWRVTSFLPLPEAAIPLKIMRLLGKSKPMVWRWQARLMVEGVEGLTRDKTRKPGKQPLPTGTRAESGRPGAQTAAGTSNHWNRPDAGEGRRSEPALGATHS